MAADLLSLTKQDMTMKILNEPQDHVNASPVVSANSLRRHHNRSVRRIADRFRRVIVNSVQMRDQQDRERTRCI